MNCSGRLITCSHQSGGVSSLQIWRVPRGVRRRHRLTFFFSPALFHSFPRLRCRLSILKTTSQLRRPPGHRGTPANANVESKLGPADARVVGAPYGQEQFDVRHGLSDEGSLNVTLVSHSVTCTTRGPSRLVGCIRRRHALSEASP